MSKTKLIQLAPRAFVQAVLRDFHRNSGLEPRLFKDSLKITNASHGTVDFELSIQKMHTNRLNTLHGGTIASLVDLCGSLAVAALGHYKTGVSTDLNVSYLRSGGVPGDSLKISAQCDKWGKTLAFTNVSFHNGAGELTARGSHTKILPKKTGAGPDGEGEPYQIDEALVEPEDMTVNGGQPNGNHQV